MLGLDETVNQLQGVGQLRPLLHGHPRPAILSGNDLSKRKGQPTDKPEVACPPSVVSNTLPLDFNEVLKGIHVKECFSLNFPALLTTERRHLVRDSCDSN